MLRQKFKFHSHDSIGMSYGMHWKIVTNLLSITILLIVFALSGYTYMCVLCVA